MTLKKTLETKPQVPISERPMSMSGATWCWRACGGFMAVWQLTDTTYRAAVNWDGRVTIPGMISLDDEFGWVVTLDEDKASEADVYGRYDLDGEEA